jgi:DNA-directed RNA polymerase subunit N (RpoN/RPB10)
MSGTSDSEYIICPHCGETMGDCWEWVTDSPAETNCDSCGKPMRVWAEHYVDYHAEALAHQTAEERDGH